MLNTVNIVFLIFLSLMGFQCLADNAPWVGNDLSGKPCVNGESMEFGPFDYLSAEEKAKHLTIVENYHFGKEVEGLQAFQGRDPTLNLNYTLTAWPNHHRALIAVTNYQLLFNSGVKNKPLMSPAECYFQRAINFSKRDGAAYLLYAKYLTKLKKFEAAKPFYESALKILPESPVVHYNYGAYFFEIGKFTEARQHAELAKKYGHPGQALLNKLDKINK